jgi:hypothetical protein
MDDGWIAAIKCILAKVPEVGPDSKRPLLFLVNRKVSPNADCAALRQVNNKVWSNFRYFCMQPWQTSVHLYLSWSFVQPSFATPLIFKVLNRIANVTKFSPNFEFLEDLVEESSSGTTNGRPPCHRNLLAARPQK